MNKWDLKVEKSHAAIKKEFFPKGQQQVRGNPPTEIPCISRAHRPAALAGARAAGV